MDEESSEELIKEFNWKELNVYVIILYYNFWRMV
jgi:hypothetical protein